MAVDKVVLRKSEFGYNVTVCETLADGTKHSAMRRFTRMSCRDDLYEGAPYPSDYEVLAAAMHHALYEAGDPNRVYMELV